jgi:acyl-CoA synthetase (AMP-forming)/AMP-acid ligase II
MTKDFLYFPRHSVSRAAFQESVQTCMAEFKLHQQVFIKTPSLPVLYAALIAAKELNISLYLCPPSLSGDQVTKLLTERQISLYLGEEKQEFPASSAETPPFLGIFTSATTGEPKIALHRWEAIESSSFFVPASLHGKTWLLSYAPWGYAGIQVFFAAYNTQGAIYYGENHFEQIASDLLKYQVEIISATPTFWRMLITAWPPQLAHPSLLQATIGGEIVDQPTIDLIDTFFHPLHLTHIYASTEAGSAIVVSDRKAGFPTSFLGKTSKSGTELRITKDHELEVRSPQSMEGYLHASTSTKDQWIATGDLVEIKNDRVYFVGRKDGRINTGGRKVSPEEIEQAIKSLPEIEDCLVYEQKSALVGALIAADVMMAPEALFDEALIKKKLKQLLEDYKVPHLIRRVNHFAISSNGKKIRHTS